MKAELRADGMHITGYVNAVDRMSRPLRSQTGGQFVEQIEPGVFARAIERAGEIRLLEDHNDSRLLASTTAGTLQLKEDAIGLYADAIITDERAIDAAKNGKVRGWSFRMSHVTSDMEERGENALPLRHIRDLDLSEVSLIVNKVPCYNATSFEVRGEDEIMTEERGQEDQAELEDLTKDRLKAYKETLKELTKGENE